ncbi:MAG: hypothetical protein GX964_01515 [Syntrophomonadaceae bacterium]|nr:hypothetical protein [Syntrophomonadaceae bacterium]
MSRIIKSDELLLDEPRVLDNFNEIIEEPTAVENTGVVDIDIEARNIIQETEEMVLDLLDKARVEAADLIENASSEAEEIKARAAREAEMLHKQTRESAYQEGLEQANREMENIQRAVREECDRMLEEARERKKAIICSAEEDIVRLSLAIAAKIMDKEVKDSDIVSNLVQKALSMLGTADSVKVLVNSEDFKGMTIDENHLNAFGSGAEVVKIQPHEAVKPGGFLIDSEAGAIDGQLETRMHNVGEALLEEVVGYD